ncbi:hypothetical protein BC938DRAFT_474847 [Jimgerdemannia flammicorona]|uniref:Uncharacterized protein n=1 Tax=Jimgerdemannia flammicorona TaxID=994334 RepID=A0A433Q1E0_9FUNG|nr:hypothetical protein BC938DRAFT_474847 [Jimgerdemannia flammicorona]
MTHKPVRDFFPDCLQTLTIREFANALCKPRNQQDYIVLLPKSNQKTQQNKLLVRQHAPACIQMLN